MANLELRQLPEDGDLVALDVYMEKLLQVLVTNKELDFSSEELAFNVDEMLADIHTLLGKKPSAIVFNSTATAAINRFPLKVTPERLRINMVSRRRSVKKGSLCPTWRIPHLLQRVQDPNERN